MILPAKDTFTSIFDTNIWNGRWKTTDGGGSGLEYTESIRTTLIPLLKKYDVVSMLDASCGEYTWMRHVDMEGIDYIGGEIVESKIRKLGIEFPHKDFRVMDIIEDPLPSVDLWMCRDTLFHFPFHYLQKTLRNFVSSDIKYLLTSTHSGVDGFSPQNVPIQNFGDFINLNLRKAPFNFPEPIDSIDDTNYNVAPLQRDMMLYTKAQVSALDFLKADIPPP